MRSILLLLAAWPFSLLGQTVFFHFTNGATMNYDVAEIEKLTFEDDQQLLWIKDGTQYAWNVSTIGHYEFDQSVGVTHVASGVEPIAMRLYPNPTDGQVTIEVMLHGIGPVLFDIYDLRGRQVRAWQIGQQPAGSYTLIWDGADATGTRVSPGAYIVRVRSNAGSTSRQLIVH